MAMCIQNKERKRKSQRRFRRHHGLLLHRHKTQRYAAPVVRVIRHTLRPQRRQQRMRQVPSNQQTAPRPPRLLSPLRRPHVSRRQDAESVSMFPRIIDHLTDLSHLLPIRLASGLVPHQQTMPEVEQSLLQLLEQSLCQHRDAISHHQKIPPNPTPDASSATPPQRYPQPPKLAWHSVMRAGMRLRGRR